MNRFFGKYKGFCTDIHDPKGRGRIKVSAPHPLGRGNSLWAEPCFQADHFFVPEEGDGVWVEFEAGDPGRPIWTGVWYKGAGSTTTAPFQETHAPLTDMDGVEVDSDKLDHRGVLDEEEHGEYHDHAAGEFYTPHRFGVRSHSGHSLEFNDHPGLSGGVRFLDRFGRGVEFLCNGLSRLRGLVLSAESGLWQDLDGNNAEGAHSVTVADSQNDSGQYIEIRDMAGAKVLLHATPGEEHILVTDYWGQLVQINSVVGSEWVEVRDKEGNRVRLENGQVTVEAASGNITLNVPTGSNVHLGGEGGEELATKTFVQSHFNTHTHISGAPGSPTSPPAIQAPLLPGSDITAKAKGE